MSLKKVDFWGGTGRDRGRIRDVVRGRDGGRDRNRDRKSIVLFAGFGAKDGREGTLQI